MGSGNNDFLASDFALCLGVGSTWQSSRVTWHNKCTSPLPVTSAWKFHSLRRETKKRRVFKDKSAMLEEVGKLPLALVWLGPQNLKGSNVDMRKS